MTPNSRIEVSGSILRHSAKEAQAYADLCPECGHREEQSSETRQGGLL